MSAIADAREALFEADLEPPPASGTGPGVLKRALLALVKAEARIRQLEAASTEPIAIVGMSCRFPGADGLAAFRDLLWQGVEAPRDVPRARWDLEAYFGRAPTSADELACRWGGFVGNVDGFDSRFFELSAREAARMDPQHRLLLEVAWEALEDAGETRARLSGASMGIVVGVSTSESTAMASGADEVDLGYALLGASRALAPARLSYFLDATGPCLMVDTLCSSSLLALHLAAQQLRSRECELAIAGGVQLMLTPKYTHAMTRTGALSPNGRCHTFDARADGYRRSEGVGFVVLKRLSRALEDGDRIYSVLRGSATNQDGRSNGLTAPQLSAQEAVIRAALANAKVNPRDVQYVELHGTGTRLGDPIEARALGQVLSAAGRSIDDRCRVGSVKTNIGHTEQAAGIAGLIKVALAIHERQLPRSLHFETPNPFIPFDALPLEVQNELTGWPQPGKPLVAGVSAFSLGGTNVHAVLAEATAERPASREPRDAHILPISARAADALERQVAQYAGLLRRLESLPAAEQERRFVDVCFTAATRRTHFEHRVAVVARSGAEAAAKLEALSNAEPHAPATGGPQAELETLRARYESGADLDWPSIVAPGAVTSLPSYPWSRVRFERTWGEARVAAATSPSSRGPAAPLVARRGPEALRARVREIVANVVGYDLGSFDDDDDLMRLGIDSLTGGRIRSALLHDLGVALPMSVLFDRASVRTLAERVAEAEPRRGPGSSLVRAPRMAHEPFALTELQRAYRFGESDAFELGNVVAHMYAEFDFERLDVDRLERCIAGLIARHPALRTVMVGEDQQRVLPSVPVYRLPVVDLSTQSDAAVGAVLDRARVALSERAPKTDEWPLVRWLVHRLPGGDGGRSRVHVTIPLVVCDGSSWIAILRELFEHYTQGVEPPGLELTLRDYLTTLATLRERGAFEESERYWSERLPGLPGGPDLPLAVDPSRIASPVFRNHRGSLPEGDWSRIKTQAQEMRVTAVAVLLAAYVEVLARWSETKHFSVTLLNQNRHPCHPQVGSLVGNLSSTIVFEAQVSTEESFADRVRRAHAQLTRDLDHASVDGVTVARRINAQNGSAGRAAVPVVFASLFTKDYKEAKFRELWKKPTFFSIQTPQVWIDFQVWEEAGALFFNWAAVDGLFPIGCVDAMASMYEALLGRVARELARWTEPLAGLGSDDGPDPALGPGAGPRVTTDATLSGMFLARAAAQPDRMAVVDPRRTLTHGELAGRAVALGRSLAECGAERNRLIAIVMEKGWEQVVAAIAIHVAGAAYLPIDASVPTERLHYLLANGDVDLVLTQSWVDARLEWPSAVRRFHVDAETSSAEGPWPEPAARPEDLAYVIYTSGSTGSPKGVMISHRAVVNTIVDLNARFAVGPEDRVLALASLSFDLSVYDVFGLLGAGGALVFPDDASGKDPAHWLDLIERERISIWNTVPAMLEMLVEHAEAQPSTSALRSLRTVMLSGDWIPVSLPDRLRRLTPRATQVSLGGATEASIWSILHPIDRVEPGAKSIPYGRAMNNQSTTVLDEQGRRCPPLVTGEIHIGGVGVAAGYWRDPERTAASFIVHRSGERLYRTGDYGRYLHDGSIELLGRRDGQVKIHGYRIELSEVEAALLSHPHVRAAAVAAVGEHGAGDKNKELVAYVVGDDSGAAFVGALREHLAQKLPAHMVVRHYELVDRLPLTANGKIDRARMRLPAASPPDRPIADNVRDEPRDEVEAQIAQMFCDLLKKDRVDAGASFFDLGGNSIHAVRLVSRIQAAFGVRLRVTALLTADSVRKLADRVREPRHGGTAARVAVLRGEGSRVPLFLVHPSGGSVLCYRRLADHLGSDQPVFAIEARGLAAGAAPHTDAASMAADYLALVRSVRPNGPYALAGWSSGGVVALEIAQRLRHAGEPTLLAMIDSFAPDTMPDGDEAQFARWFVADLTRTAGRPTGTRLDRTAEGHPRAEWLAEVVAELRARDPDFREISHDELSRLFDVYQATFRAARAYRPSPYDGELLLVRASDALYEVGADDALGWRPHCPRMQVEVLAADHFSLVTDPAVEAVARAIGGRIETFVRSARPTAS